VKVYHEKRKVWEAYLGATEWSTLYSPPKRLPKFEELVSPDPPPAYLKIKRPEQVSSGQHEVVKESLSVVDVLMRDSVSN
jgi:hypothetical protein